MNGDRTPVMVRAAATMEWPRCYGERIPAKDRGGCAAICAATLPPVVTFAPPATPTGLAFYDGPDFPAGCRGALYVALWNDSSPQVLRVQLAERDGRMAGGLNGCRMASGARCADISGRL